jgi:hypothetical protein
MKLNSAEAAEVVEILIRNMVEVYRIDDEAKVVTIHTKPELSKALQTHIQSIIGEPVCFCVLPENWNPNNVTEVAKRFGSAIDKEFSGMTKAEYMAFHEECCKKMMTITRAKNSDYTGDSGDPFANFAQIGMLVQAPSVVEIGFLTRMSDKLSRIGSFVTKGTLLVKDESVEDTLLDLANYCLLFAGYLRSKRQA